MARRSSTAVAPVRRGTRNPALLAETSGSASDEQVGTVYVVGIKPLRYHGHVLPPGTEVPGAGSWLRLEAWIDARRVRRLRTDEAYMTFEGFLASLEGPPDVPPAEAPQESTPEQE